MPTYSEWLDSTRALYTTAMTNAFNNRNNPDTDNSYYKAWQAMNSVGDLATILPTNSAFYGGSPDGDESDILLFQGYLQSNPVVAGWLSLEPTLTFRADQRSSLGTAGTVGGQKRRWKGNPVYTFANGVLIGKDNQIVAAIGTEGGEDLDGFGTDTIAYFDGVPFSTGTGVPGSVVFRGDTVISGSIKGAGGVVIIDDVIQLETGVTNPAGIGVDSDGKIRVRHRGEGCVDLVDEINAVQANVDGAADTAANIAKLWQGVQNTSSAQWGTSLIPNSNFSFKTVDPTDGYSDRIVGVISVGTTNNIVTIPADGVCGFQGSSMGICLQAVPIESERYAIRIRYRGGSAETLDADGTEEGLFLSFHETSDDAETIGDNTFIYDNSTPGTGYEGSEVHTSNVTVNYPTNTTSTDGGGATDGVSIQETYQVKSYLYVPNENVTAASLVIYTKNYVDVVSIDYVVMTESPLTTTQINDLIDEAVDDIDLEVDDPDISVVTDPQMTDSSLWAGYNGATLANSTDGLTTGGDKAITVSVPAGGGGITSSAIACESDRYLVGAKVRVLSSVGNIVPNISMFAIENPNQSYPTIGNPTTSPLSFPYGDNVIKNIQIVEVNSSGTPDPTGAGSSVAVPIAELDGLEPLYTMVIGTYEVNVTYIDANGIEYSSFDPTIQTTAQLPGTFSLVVHADTECELSVDYVYGRLQGASVNIAQSLADTAYTDAHGFVTDMNEQLIRESGSIITNASMAILDSNNKPSGWRTDIATGTLTLDTTGDNSIKITQVPGFDSSTQKLRLITPPFNLGTADKFSIGVSIKGTSAIGNASIIVATTTDSMLSSSYVTIANTDGGNPDVLAGATETTIGSSFTTVVGSFDNTLVTWNRGDVQQTHGGMGSIIIECDEDFEVDFVFVKEQTVSYNLADAQAVARREEAIRSAAGFVANIGDSLADEAGSFITNAGFSSWYVDPVSNKQRPQKWLLTRYGSSIRRAIPATEVTITEPQDVVDAAKLKETRVTNKGINGSAIQFNPSVTSGGILSSKFQLPVASSWTDPDSGTTETTTGSYTLSVRLKLDTPNLIGVRLYAHELNSLPSAEIDHVFGKDSIYGSPRLEGSDRSEAGTPLDNLQLFTTEDTDPGPGESYDGRIQRIKLINVSQNDLSVGYDGDDDFGEGFDDEYIEYLPVDIGDDDGDQDGTNDQNVDVWYDISGTYKPHAEAKVVCFEILIEGDVDQSYGAASLIYVDYVSLITQPFDTDFAQTLADARAESIATIKTGELETTIGLDHADWSSYSGNTTLAELLVATKNSVDAVETTLAAEDPSTTLIPNSFFSMPDDTSTSVEDWIPTRSTTGTITRTVTPANGSYGSYISLGSNSVSDETHGLLSKAISVLGNGVDTGLVDGGLTQNPNFDLVIRFRQNNGDPEQISWQMVAHEFWSDSLTGSNEYVFENGYGDLVTNQPGVELFNGGVTGNAVALQMIFTDETSPEDPLLTEEVGDNTNWRTLVATYTPTANAKWVSFEFVLNEDYDNNDVRPTVQIDGILLQKSDSSPLALEIQAAAAAAQQATEDNADNIGTNADNITSNSDDIVINTGNISDNESSINTINTSVALMKAADTELFLIQTAMANETDSKIPNAAFLQPTSMTVTNDDGEEVPNLAIPGSFLQFHRTPFLFRATNEFATNTAITSAYTDLGSGTSRPESVDTPYYDVGQNGTALIVPAVARDQDVVGFYTSAVIIPNAGGTGTSSGTQDPATGDNDFTGELSFDSRGQYTISFKVKNLSNVGSESITVSIKAHEYYSGIGPATEAGFITEASSGYEGFGAGTSTGIGTSYSSDNDQTITIIKLSDASDTTFGSSETLAQVADVTTSSGWVTVGGTYTASTDCECVSFSLSVDIDDDNDDTEAYDQNNDVGQFEWYNIFPALAVDFIYCASQSFTADMAEQITASRVYTVQQELEGDLTTLEGNLGSESSSLMPNGNFQQTFEDGSLTYAKNWVPTGTGVPDKLRLYDSASDSIGTYIKFHKNAGSNTSGIISKAIQTPTQNVIDGSGNIGNYILGLRIRGVTDYAAPISNTTWSTLSVGSENLVSSGNPGSSSTFGWLNGGPNLRIYNSTGYDFDDPVSGDKWIPSDLSPTSADSETFWNFKNGSISWSSSFVSNARAAVIYVPIVAPQSDVSRDFELTASQTVSIPQGGSVTLPKSYKYRAWVTPDAGATWTEVGSSTSASTLVAQVDNIHFDFLQTQKAKSGGGPVAISEAWLVYALEPPEGGTSGLPYWDTLTLDTSGSSTNMDYFGSEMYIRYFRQSSNTTTSTQIPNFSVKIVAHESFQGQSDALVYVNQTTPSYGLTVGDAAADVGITRSSFVAGNEVELNIIDLRYSQSTPGTEITIDAQAQDNTESIQDWRNIVGSYTPSEDCTAVSFEIIVDHNVDGDTMVQEVWLDSATLAIGTITQDLAQSIADNRIFVEQNFEGGETPVSPLNVIKNADFSKTILVDSSFAYSSGTDDLKRPANWHYFGEENTSWDWSDTKFMISPDSTTTNRGVRFELGETVTRRYGIASAPFRISSAKYKWRVRFKPVGFSATANFFIFFLTTHQTLQENTPTVIVNTTVNGAGYGYYYPDDTQNHIEHEGFNSDFSRQAIYNTSTTLTDGVEVVLEGEFVPATVSGSSRPGHSDLPEYGSMVIYRYGVSGGAHIDVFEASMEPVGQAYGSWNGNANSEFIASADYSTDGSYILPDVPREIEEAEPQLNSIDIKVTDTSSASTVGNALLLALPRNYYNSNSGTTKLGTSFYYPGVGDLKYNQGVKETNAFVELILALIGIPPGTVVIDHPYRTLEFPASGTLPTRIENINNIEFKECENTNGDYNYRSGGYHALSGTGDRSITNLGALLFNKDYAQKGYGDTDTIFGGTIQNVRQILINANEHDAQHWGNVALPINFADMTTEKEKANALLNPLCDINRKQGITIMQEYNCGGISFVNSLGLEHYDNRSDFKPQRFSRWSIGITDYSDRFGFCFNGGSTYTVDSDYEALTGLHGDDGYGTFPTSTTNDQHGTIYGYIDTDKGQSSAADTSDGSTYGTANFQAAKEVDSGLDMNHFTGQHRSIGEGVDVEDHLGMIVVASGRYNTRRIPEGAKQININNAHPTVELSSKRNQKSAFGVVSNAEDVNDQGGFELRFGNWVSLNYIDNDEDKRLIINSLGEGAVWICNINGNLENGDYITTCEIPGYGMLQDDDLLHNYTVAKITQDCTFELDNPYYDCVEFEYEGNTYRKAFVGCTYHCG